MWKKCKWMGIGCFPVCCYPIKHSMSTDFMLICPITVVHVYTHAHSMQNVSFNSIKIVVSTYQAPIRKHLCNHIFFLLLAVLLHVSLHCPSPFLPNFPILHSVMDPHKAVLVSRILLIYLSQCHHLHLCQRTVQKKFKLCGIS